MENEDQILDTQSEDEVVDVEITDEEPADTDGAEEVEATENTDDAEDEKGGFDIDDLEYDENGDIIIPDDTAEEASSEPVENAENKEEAKQPEKDPKDDTIEALRHELDDIKAQALDTLKKLGVDTEDAMDGLASLAAETDGDTKEEYIRKRDEARAKEIADAKERQTAFEQVAAQDLAELQAKYPETKAYKHVKDMPADILRKFARNRDLGLSAEEAYAAANPDGIRTSVAASVKREVSGKEHLQSNVPKGSNKTAVKMSRAELEEWREIFGDRKLSDKEIVALYRKTK